MATFARVFLGINGLVFLALGVSGLTDPVAHMAVFDAHMEGTSLLAEIRANYGGMHIGMALLFLWGAVRAPWLRPALVTLGLFVTGLAVGRTLSLVVDGTPNNAVLAFIAVEWIGAAIAWWLVARTKQRAGIR